MSFKRNLNVNLQEIAARLLVRLAANNRFRLHEKFLMRDYFCPST